MNTPFGEFVDCDGIDLDLTQVFNIDGEPLDMKQSGDGFQDCKIEDLPRVVTKEGKLVKPIVKKRIICTDPNCIYNKNHSITKRDSIFSYLYNLLWKSW